MLKLLSSGLKSLLKRVLVSDCSKMAASTAYNSRSEVKHEIKFEPDLML